MHRTTKQHDERELQEEGDEAMWTAKAHDRW